jgi:hypothetical protein
MTVRIIQFALFVVTACGVPEPPPTVDAGPPDTEPPDTGPPPCFVRSLTGEPSPDAETCGVCLEPHARIANPVDLTVGFDQHVVAVPGGLVALLGPRLVFVGDDGTVDPYLGRPEHVQDFFPTFELTAVPDTRQVWVISYAGRAEEGTDVVLLEHDATDGWRRLASGAIPFLGHGAALDDGTLVGWDSGFGLTRARALSDGSIDFRWAPGETLFSGLPSGRFVDVLGLPGGLAGVTMRTIGLESSSWLVVTDSDLDVVRPAVELGPDPRRSIYAQQPFPIGGAARSDGTLVLVLMGSLAGMDAWPYAHNWLLRIEPDGSFREPPPGILMNPTLYMMGEGTGGSGGPPIIFPDGYDGVAWTLHDGRLEDGGQVVDAAGAAMFVPEHEFGELSGLTFPSARDGGDRTYGFDGRYNYAVAHWNRHFERVWSRRLQQCEDRVDDYSLTLAGAYDDGLWVVWEDDQPDNTGNVVRVPKVARLHADGSWAWGAE